MLRTPTASSRCRSQSGEGPTVTPLTTAAWNRAQPSVSSIAMRTPPVDALRSPAGFRNGGTSTDSVPGIEGSRYATPSENASSRATPL